MGDRGRRNEKVAARSHLLRRREPPKMAADVLKACGCLSALALCTVLFLVSNVQPAGNVHAAVLEAAPTEESGPLSSVGLGDSENKQKWNALPSSIQAKRDIPRMDFNFKKVSNKFCGGNNYTIKQKCSKAYMESLVMTALPLMIIAAATVILGLLVLIGRNCCVCFGNGCCGGRIPSQGICFGPPLEKQDGYTPYRRKLYIFLVVAILVLVVVAMCVGFSGNSQLSQAIRQLMKTTESIPAEVHRQIVFINAEILGLQQLSTQVNPGADVSMWTTVMTSLTEIQKSVKKMQTQASEAHHKVRKYEQTRSDFLEWAFIVAPILATCGILGYLLPSLLTIFVIPLVLLCTILAWVVVGVHIPVSVATADFCVDLNYALKHPNASMGGLSMVLECGGKQGAGKMLKSGEHFIAQSYHKACHTLTSSLCKTANITYVGQGGRTNILLPVKCPAMQCNRNTLHQFMNLTEVADFKYGCATLKKGSIVTVDCSFTDKSVAVRQCLSKYGNTDVQPCVPNGVTYRFTKLPQCARTCFLNSTKTMAHKIAGNYEILSRFQALKTKKLEPLSGCKIIRSGVSELERTLCWKVVNATDYIIAGLAIIGITFLLGTVVYLGAQKVFNRKFWAEYYEKYWDELHRERQLPGETGPLLGVERSAADQA